MRVVTDSSSLLFFFRQDKQQSPSALSLLDWPQEMTVRYSVYAMLPASDFSPEIKTLCVTSNFPQLVGIPGQNVLENCLAMLVFKQFSFLAFGLFLSARPI